MTDQPRRAVAYVRVSDEGGRGDALMSPAIQLTAIEDHCRRRGHQLVTVLEDIDRTGRLWKRRQMETAVKLIEAATCDVVVVWKLSRVSRNRLDWAVAVERIESAGGQLESATEQLDTSTSAGRCARGMLAELAAFESERMGETWREVHRQRTDRGLPHSGPIRLGYDYTRAGYEPNGDAQIVRELFDRYVEGEGLGSLTAWLRAEGVTGARGKPWSRFGVSYYLRSGFAAGFLHVHDPDCRCGKRDGSCPNRVHVQGAHEAIIDAEQWTAAQTVRAARGGTPIRCRVPVSRLSGLVICAGCEHPMQLQASSGKPRHAYVCRTNRLTLDACPAPAWVRRQDVEDAARRWLEGVAPEIDAQARSAPREPATPARQERLTRSLADVDRALGKLAADLARGLVPETAYLAARDELQADRQAVIEQLNRLDADEPAPVLGLLELWDQADPHVVVATVRPLLRVRVERGGGVEVRRFASSG